MGNLYQIWEQVVISAIHGDLPTDAEVCLPVSCLMFGNDGTLFLETENGKTSEGSCFFIAADVTFKATPVNCKGFVIVFFDAVSSEHYFLNAKYKGQRALKIDWEVNKELLIKAFSKMDETRRDVFLNELFIELFNIDRNNISHEYDDRIVLIDRYIREKIREKISNRELAAKIHLSESRFYHFFKE